MSREIHMKDPVSVVGATSSLPDTTGRFRMPTRFSTTKRICKHAPPILASRLRLLGYPPHVASRERRIIAAQAQTGSILEGDTIDFHFYPFALQGYFEFRNVAIASAIASPGDVIVEVGANVGTETISFSDIVGADGKVHAIEPLPANIRWLRRAAEISRFKNITVHECALSDAEKRGLFHEPPESSSGVGHLLGTVMADRRTVDVCVTTLDSLREVIGSAKLVFVDIEGNEVRFLRGATTFLRTYRPALVIEASPKLLRREHTSIAELHDALRSYEYVAFRVGRFSTRPANPSTQRHAENWLCLPEERMNAVRKVNRRLLSCALLPCVRGINPLTRA